MRFEPRLSIGAAPLEVETRWIERAHELAEVIAPVHWTTARVEAWLAWADCLPTDFPTIDLPSSLSPDAPYAPLLSEGPDRFARRTAAWGLALGHFDGDTDAASFQAELTALLTRGAFSPGPSLHFGARVHPLASDPAGCPQLEKTEMASIDHTRTRPAGAKTHAHRSETRDDMRIEWDVPIAMDDGLILRADIFRPLTEGRHPVILSYGPYGKGLAFQDGYPSAWPSSTPT